MRSELCLVTGAPGWLGTRLVERLCQLKRKVRCLVLNPRLSKHLKEMGAQIVKGDVTDKSTLYKALDGVYEVIHCAGIIHPKKIKDFYLVNTEGTRNLLEISVKGGVKKFIYISSNSAQGRNIDRDTLMTEDGEHRPYMSYGKSKLIAEQIVKEFYEKHDLFTVIIRPCWYYGPGQPDRQTKLMRMIKSARPLLFGGGKNLRSMSYIDNIIDAILLAENKDVANGKTYWIADETPYTTLEIYQTIADILGVELKPRFIPSFISALLRFGDNILQRIGVYNQLIHVGGEMTENIACSIEKAKRELGYKTKISLKEGMEISIDWAARNNLIK